MRYAEVAKLYAYKVHLQLMWRQELSPNVRWPISPLDLAGLAELNCCLPRLLTESVLPLH
jgi:hypothetical protein